MKNRNILVKSKAFVNTMRIKGADFEDEPLFQILFFFCLFVCFFCFCLFCFF